ncbi:hypothetical protein [Methylosinus sp. KRF6]|uniref:hypothetical protein n=1 Tax=Methylosinus sp. KRF6 TaxID=2846853 RepID=UPI001C0C90A0|nr:hypothetical protein [Methylosinus sp. KRF6]MBU3887624.1 hypothetical protein [Methylosinus sp. KRF6]
MSTKNNIAGKYPKAESIETTEKTIGRTVTILARVVEYDTDTGRALVVPTDTNSVDQESMSIPFANILRWHERKATEAAVDGAK